MLYKATSKLKKRRPETLGINPANELERLSLMQLIHDLKHSESISGENVDSFPALLENGFIEAANEIKETDDASTI